MPGPTWVRRTRTGYQHQFRLQRRDRRVRGPGEGRRYRPDQGCPDRAPERFIDRIPDADDRSAGLRDPGEETGSHARRRPRPRHGLLETLGGLPPASPSPHKSLAPPVRGWRPWPSTSASPGAIRPVREAASCMSAKPTFAVPSHFRTPGGAKSFHLKSRHPKTVVVKT